MSRLGKLFYSHRIGSQNEHWRFLCLIVEKDLFHREISLVRFLGMPIFKYVPQRDNSHVRICGLRVRKIPGNSSSTVCVYGNRWDCCRAFHGSSSSLTTPGKPRFFCLRWQQILRQKTIPFSSVLHPITDS